MKWFQKQTNSKNLYRFRLRYAVGLISLCPAYRAIPMAASVRVLMTAADRECQDIYLYFHLTKP